MPTGLAARFRGLIAGRRLLVLLDNARSAEQVRPLPPGTTTAHTLITSRNTLGTLLRMDGCAREGLARHRAALSAAQGCSIRYCEANAHRGWCWVSSRI